MGCNPRAWFSAVPAIFGTSLFQTSRSRKLKAVGESSSPFPRHIREPYIPRGPMRPTVRPFKIEFKSRSSRSTPMRPPRGDDAGKDRATPSFLDVAAFTAGRNSHANNYEAAMKAADAVFGRSVPRFLRLRRTRHPTPPWAGCCRASSRMTTLWRFDWPKPMKRLAANARQERPRPPHPFCPRSRPPSPQAPWRGIPRRGRQRRSRLRRRSPPRLIMSADQSKSAAFSMRNSRRARNGNGACARRRGESATESVRGKGFLRNAGSAPRPVHIILRGRAACCSSARREDGMKA